MWNKLDEIIKRYQELEEQMASPEVLADQKRVQALAKERADIEELASDYLKYKDKSKQLEETKAMLHDRLDEGMASLVKQEIQSLEKELEPLLEKLKEGLRPRDPNDSRDIIMEIACSAVVTVFPPGVFITTMPLLDAAGMSTLSRPVPALPMTFRLSAAAMISAVTLVAPRMANP